MNSIDKVFVKKSFNSAAATYDQHARVQQRWVEHVMGMLADEKQFGGRVLDIGTGTGELFMRLRQRFPAAQVHGCDLAVSMLAQARARAASEGRRALLTATDAEALPYSTAAFDLVASSFTYQWLAGWEQAFQEVGRVLRPGGTFVLAAFGADTFFELRESYAAACRELGYAHGQALQLSLAAPALDQALKAAGFADVRVRACRTVEAYATVHELLKAIKGMGARNVSNMRNRALGVRRVWPRMVAHYLRRYGAAGCIPATFEIVFAQGTRAG